MHKITLSPKIIYLFSIMEQFFLYSQVVSYFFALYIICAVWKWTKSMHCNIFVYNL